MQPVHPQHSPRAFAPKDDEHPEGYFPVEAPLADAEDELFLQELRELAAESRGPNALETATETGTETDILSEAPEVAEEEDMSAQTAAKQRKASAKAAAKASGVAAAPKKRGRQAKPKPEEEDEIRPSPKKRGRKSGQEPGTEAGTDAGTEAASKKRKPIGQDLPGFPPLPATARKFFFQEFARLRPDKDADEEPNLKEPPGSTASLDKEEEEPPAESPAESVEQKEKPMSFLKRVNEAWKALSPEQLAAFEAKAAEDVERFRQDFEAWVSEHPESMQHIEVMRCRKRYARPRIKEAPAMGELGKILKEAAALKPPPSTEMPPPPLPASKRGGESDDRLPSTPQSTGSGKSEEDIFGELAGALELGHPESVAYDDAPIIEDVDPNDSENDNSSVGGFQPIRDEGGGDFFGQPVALGEPQALGPQLRLDADGNIIVNADTLEQGVDMNHAPIDISDGNVQDAVAHYEQAYRKSKPAKWTDEETQMFYDALSCYGTDLFLVQTFFLNKSAHHIKTKYAKELKKNPAKVEEYLMQRAKKLTAEQFEAIHGPIDTAKHYQPIPEPPPGMPPPPSAASDAPPEEEPTPEGPPQEEFPPEPEYTEEDELLTTNRLMDLFDD